VSAYITGAALLIIISQLKHILGIGADGTTALALIKELGNNVGESNAMAFLIGIVSIGLFLIVRKILPFVLVRLHVRAKWAKLISRMAPILIIAAFVILSEALSFETRFDLRVVGEVPSGLPPFASLRLLSRLSRLWIAPLPRKNWRLEPEVAWIVIKNCSGLGLQMLWLV